MNGMKIVGILTLCFMLLMPITFGAESHSPIAVAFEKFDLSFSAPPEFNKPVELTLDVVYVYNRENITIYIDLPDGFELVSGDLKWEGNYVKNTPVQLKAVVKPVKTGEWMIRGFFNFDSEIGPAKILHVSVSEKDVQSMSTLNIQPNGTIQAGKLLTRVGGSPSPSRLKVTFSSDSTILSASPITITGYMEYLNKKDGQLYPIRYARVKLYEDSIDYPLNSKETWTDVDGKFTIPDVDNDGEIYRIEVYADNDGYTGKDAVNVRTGDLISDTYYGYAETVTIPADGNIGNWSDNRECWYIFDKTIDGYEYLFVNVNDRNGFDYDKDGLSNGDAWNQPKIKVYWPKDHSDFHRTPFYYIHIENTDWRPDVILHEYGHAIMDKVYDGAMPESNCPSPHFFDQPSNLVCALTEGWATFILTAIENSSSTIWGNLESGLQRPNDVQPADQVEGEDAGIWWDIFDPANEARDAISLGIDPIWDIFTIYNPSDINEFWEKWFQNGKGYDSELWDIYYNHGINKDTDPPDTPTLISPSGTITDPTPTFSWNEPDDWPSGIDYYQIQVADNIAFSNPVIDKTRGSAYTYYTAPSGVLSSGVTYYWHVWAVDNSGNDNHNKTQILNEQRSNSEVEVEV